MFLLDFKAYKAGNIWGQIAEWKEEGREHELVIHTPGEIINNNENEI